MKVDLERLRRGVTNARNGVRYGPGEPMAALTIDELEALLAVVDAARKYLSAPDTLCAEEWHAYWPLARAVEPFGPAGDGWTYRTRVAMTPAGEPLRPARDDERTDDRAWEEVDRWHAERDLAVKAAVDAAKGNPRDRARDWVTKQGPTDEQRKAFHDDCREEVRDQLADAGVAVQRQFRSDQERIAELETERDEWRGRHKAVTNGLSNHVARADQAEEALRELVAAVDDAGPGAMWTIVGEEREQHIRAVLDGAKP